MSVFKIGKIEAEPGTKEHGYLDVGEFPTGYLIHFPLMIINGANKGPTLCLVAGVHAMEYCGIETVMRIFTDIDPKALSGTVVAVPLVNIPAFQARTPYVNPIDRVNGFGLGKGGIGEGSISYVMGEVLFKQVLSKADSLINLHGGDSVEENLDFVIVNETGNPKIDKVSMDMAKCFCPEYLWVYNADISWIKDSDGNWAKTSENRKDGGLHKRTMIPTVIPEAGGSGKVQEESVRFLYDGTINVMKYFKMLYGPPAMREPKVFHTQHRIRVRSAGFFRPLKKLGQIVAKAEVIGNVRNIFGEVTEEVTSPVDGLFNFLMFHASVLPGDVVIIIGELRPTRKEADC
jgi:predicted deacylase